MIEMIFAVGLNGELGKDNKLLWKQKEDMKHFIRTTKGKNVVMGRKTFDSLHTPLNGRKNYVLSNSTKMSYYENHNTYVEYLTYDELMKKDVDFIVIGGAEIYELFKANVDVMHITIVMDKFPQADTFLPEMTLNDFELADMDLYPSDSQNDHLTLVYKLVRLK